MSPTARAIIQWDGRGWLVPVVLFASSLAAEVLVESMANDDTFYQTTEWPLGLAFVLAGVVLAAIAKRLPERPSIVTMDKTTGETVTEPSPGHRFLWIPVRWWPAVCFAIAAGRSVWAALGG